MTESWFAFRQETDINPDIYQHDFQHFDDKWELFIQPARFYRQDPVREVEAIADILGLTGEHLFDILQPNDTLPFQELGQIAMPQGRLITFPNTIEHRREPLKLIDANVPGHHHCVTLHLVDPHYRICSTRNVPPQQHDWWVAPVAKILIEKGLPAEVVALITSFVDEWPMKNEEAEVYKREMVKEKGWMTIARNCTMLLGAFE